ncbi:JDVT-CTERM system CAAX-type protease [Ectothiorhodospiraceae bacterium 2226]|nr:JDVT-CTERM system CAAX-type protease [Ectothiorhodospiraceae bacterium 2226]
MAGSASGLSARRARGRAAADPLLWLALAAALPVWAVIAWWRPLADPAWPLALPATFALLVLVYPVVEELVFRGALQGALLSRAWGRRRWGPVSLANGLTTAAFVSLHLLYQPWAWALAVVAPSLVFGYFRERHGSVWTPIVLHVTYNAGFFWLFGVGEEFV